MGLFDFMNKSALKPTVLEKDRPRAIVATIEDLTAKLSIDPAISLFGDYSDGIRLQLILGYLQADRDPAISKLDSTTSQYVVGHYHHNHWANETPNLLELLSTIIDSQKIELMEMDLDRAIYNKNKPISEQYGCISYACLGINSKYKHPPIPLLEKKNLAFDLAHSTSIMIKNIVGQMYGSQSLLNESELQADELKKWRVDLQNFNLQIVG